MTQAIETTATRMWAAAGVPADVPGRLTVTGPSQVLPSAFDVTGLAAASVAAATLAAAGFQAARTGERPRAVAVDSRGACAAFASEALFTPLGWERPQVWDPVAGNYQARDGWIRLHTNYAYHRAAVEKVLGATGKEAVRRAVATWQAADLETAVVAAGGCAAAMQAREAWLASPAGSATAQAPLLAIHDRPGGTARPAPPASVAAPYAGIRVLDLTRVIAGPVGTRFLAAYGADVLRIDPPGFAEVPALVPETTAGKRTAALDLTTSAGRATFERLLSTADVLVTGLRADALARLGYDDAALESLSPGLIIASLDAYGWSGPWRDRRGFDSLVQMSCGINAAGAEAAGTGKPVALPVQALDHATGYLLAAAIGRALTRRLAESVASRIRASLIATANFLWSLPGPEELAPAPDPADFPLVAAQTAWGPARRVPIPGEITGVPAGLRVAAGPLGRHEARWP